MIDIKNEYIIKDDYVVIFLRCRDGTCKEAYIDLDDLDKILSYKYTWHTASTFKNGGHYAAATEYLGCVDGKSKSRSVYLHRFILGIEDDSIKIDHINHNMLDNRKINLRPSNDYYNTKHRKSKNTNNTSGYRNVSHDGSGNPIVQLQDRNGKNHVWRNFKTVEEAGEFAEQKRREWYGEYAGRN